MEVTTDPSNSGFIGVMGWKLHYSKLESEGEPALVLAW